MSWHDRLGNRRGEDEDYGSVEAEQNAPPPKALKAAKIIYSILIYGTRASILDSEDGSKIRRLAAIIDREMR